MSVLHWVQLGMLVAQCGLLFYVIRLRQETKRNAERSEAALKRARGGRE